MKQKRAVIIAGGSMSGYSYIKQLISPEDTIIAADSGYLHAKKLGLIPDIVLGDFDSLGFVPQDVPIIEVPAKKDLTDTELALHFARDKGIKDFLFLAAFGTRMDHTLANIFLLAQLLEYDESGQIIDEHNRVWITNAHLRIDVDTDAYLSLIPITNCFGVTTENLAYPLSGAKLEVGKGLGISNLATKNPVQIRLTEGTLLVVQSSDSAKNSE